MIFHETAPSETLTSIAKDYGTTVQMLIAYNGIPNPENLVVGQCIAIVYPEIVHTVTGGENLYSIAQYYDVSLNELYRNNPKLRAGSMIYPGESLVIKLEDDIIGDFETGGYTYTDSNIGLIESTMPFMNYLMPFTYGFSALGELTALEDEKFIEIAHKYRRKCFFHLSTLTPEGYYSDKNAKVVLASNELQNTLIDRILRTIESKGYNGLDIDFEYISAEYAERYAEFIYKVRERLNSYGYEVFAALAPKTSDDQKGVLYEGHLYKEIGDAANAVLIMTYEWGYTHPQRRHHLPKVQEKKEGEGKKNVKYRNAGGEITQIPRGKQNHTGRTCGNNRNECQTPERHRKYEVRGADGYAGCHKRGNGNNIADLQRGRVRIHKRNNQKASQNNIINKFAGIGAAPRFFF